MLYRGNLFNIHQSQKPPWPPISNENILICIWVHRIQLLAIFFIACKRQTESIITSNLAPALAEDLATLQLCLCQAAKLEFTYLFPCCPLLRAVPHPSWRSKDRGCHLLYRTWSPLRQILDMWWRDMQIHCIRLAFQLCCLCVYCISVRGIKTVEFLCADNKS